MKPARVIALLAMFVLVLSCAQPPKAEVDAARSAIAAAQSDPDVIAYSPDALQQAKDALARMEQFLKDRKYPEAKAAALQATSLAATARQGVAAAKQQAQNDATALIADAKKQLTALLPTVAAAKRAKPRGLDLTALDNDLNAARSKLADADSALSAGRFIDARDGASTVKAALSDIEKRISDAIQAARKKK
ncbi:MAG TPA: DUF4398 domain-containing protein [Rectinemataceae bacterium]|nr:DUF4398 domain-containing protein [Rectinemataceae bacterium]